MLWVMGGTRVSIPRDQLLLPPCSPLSLASLGYNMDAIYPHYNVGDDVAAPPPEKTLSLIAHLISYLLKAAFPPVLCPHSYVTCISQQWLNCCSLP